MRGVRPSLPPGVDLASMALRSLVVRDIGSRADSAPRSLRDPDVPAAHYCADEPWLFDWRGWNSDRGGSLSVYITGGAEPLSVRVVPADGSWRRSYTFSSNEYSDAEAPIANMPGLPARLEYLRLRAATVLGFLLCEAEFPALRRVRVDVPCTAPADRTAELFENSNARCDLEDELAQSRFRVRCPALAVVTFHRTRGTLAVRQKDVVFLCRALTETKPALELCGVDVAPREPSYWSMRDDDDDGDSLDDFFSSVTSIATPGGDAFDDDAWADVDAVLRLRYLRQSLAS